MKSFILVFFIAEEIDNQTNMMISEEAKSLISSDQAQF